MQSFQIQGSLSTIILLVFVSLVPAQGWENRKSPTSMTPTELAERCRSMLDSLIDFYLPASLDHEYGGYLETLDTSGSFAAGDKFLTLQARQLWFFSTLAVNNIRTEQSLKAAESGYDFIVKHFFDPQHGGYYSIVTQSGEPKDRRKHVYLNAFLIYAFVEYHRATGLEEPLEKAVELFETLERHCYDQQHGGYQEFFYANWELITDSTESGYVGAINTKTYNSHLHLLESFAQLYRVKPIPLVRQRLAELLAINTLTVKHPQHPCNIDGWLRDWTMIPTPQNLRVSYGHDLECSWLVLDAAEALDLPTDLLLSWAKPICDHAIEFGYDSIHGGFFHTGPLGQASDDRKKEWWPQTEALVALITLYRLTGDQQYFNLFSKTLDFVQKHHLAPEGGWWATVNEDGSLGPNLSRTSMWQGAYHNGRALLICEKILRGMK